MAGEVMVFAEQRGGRLRKVALENVSAGRRVADQLGVELCAVLVGREVESLSDQLGQYGADRVCVAEGEELAEYTTSAYSHVLTSLAKEREPAVLLLGGTSLGRDLAPRVAARLQTGLAAGLHSI